MLIKEDKQIVEFEIGENTYSVNFNWKKGDDLSGLAEALSEMMHGKVGKLIVANLKKHGKKIGDEERTIELIMFLESQNYDDPAIKPTHAIRYLTKSYNV